MLCDAMPSCCGGYCMQVNISVLANCAPFAGGKNINAQV